MSDEQIVEHLKHRPFIDCAELLREALRLAREREWIKTRDRLPEVGDKVLVYFGDIDNVLIGYLACNDHDCENKVWVVYFKDGEVINQGDESEDITHWMPLPNPPTK